MGAYSTGNLFYLPALGATGETERAAYNTAMSTAATTILVASANAAAGITSGSAAMTLAVVATSNAATALTTATAAKALAIVATSNAGTALSTATAALTTAQAAIAKAICTAKGELIVYTGSATPIRLAAGAEGQVFTVSTAAAANVVWATPITVGAIEAVIDGGGAVISSGAALDIEVPFNCTFSQVTLLANTVGTFACDIRRAAYAGFPPASASSICATTIPAFANASVAQDANLTSWSKTATAGDVLRFNVMSVSTGVTRCMVSLKYTR